MLNVGTVVEAILDELDKRKGFDRWWEEIDHSTQGEIKHDLDERIFNTLGDGYHNLKQMYDMRLALTVALMEVLCEVSNIPCWRAKLHHDGTMFIDYFIVGIELPVGQVTWHYHIKHWDLFGMKNLTTLDRAPEFDGHTEDDVVRRLLVWLKGEDASIE
jgi:hypothetical protein